MKQDPLAFLTAFWNYASVKKTSIENWVEITDVKVQQEDLTENMKVHVALGMSEKKMIQNVNEFISANQMKRKVFNFSLIGHRKANLRENFETLWTSIEMQLKFVVNFPFPRTKKLMFQL